MRAVRTCPRRGRLGFEIDRLAFATESSTVSARLKSAVIRPRVVGLVERLCFERSWCAQRMARVTKDDKEIVSAVLRALVDRVGQDSFDLWFAGRARLEFAAGTLRITAPDPFSLDRLRHKLRGDLEAACRVACGHVPQLEFALAAREAAAEGTATADGLGSNLNPSPCHAAPLMHRKSDGSNPRPPLAPRTAAASMSSAASPSAARDGHSAAELPKRKFAGLESYVVGDGNRLAYTAARSAIAKLGTVSPLFLYGATGCGKTHLLEGLLTEARRSGRVRRAVMLSSEQFTSHFLEALQGSGLPSFRRKYRDVEMLLLDDVQFFAGKKATLVEVQHTVDTLLRDGRQLVFAADRPPSELHGLGPEVAARMSGGLVCGIQPAEEATRVEIVRRMARRAELDVPEPVLEFIGQQLGGDARQLAGALNRLHATSLALQRPITLELAQTALADVLRATRRIVRLPDIERAICDVFGLEPASLQSDRKARTVSQPRMLAMWLARKYTRAALSEIGHYFGRRSHTTVISAQKKMNRLMEQRATIQLDQSVCNIEDALRRVEAQLRTG